MVRRRKDNPTKTTMQTPTNSNRRRQGKFPILILVVCSVVILYCTMFLTTFDSIGSKQLRSKQQKTQNNTEAASTKGSTLTAASDKTYVSKVTSANECKTFDHGDTSPTPNIKSLFNCNSEEGKCKWHYPAKFFDPFCGIGKDFVEEVQLLQTMHKNRTLWLDGPPIVIPWLALDPGVTAHTYRKEPYPVHNLSMTHVHKTGGTSLVNAFGAILKHNARGKRHLVYMPSKRNMRMPKNPKLQPKSFNNSKSYNEVDKFLNGAVKYKSDWGLTDHTLFAVIRDPAERFISAIGQATGAFGSTANGVGKKLLDECLKTTPKETLTCFVNLVETDSTLIEIHFTPMALEISFATMWKDIPVAVFPFQEVPSLLNEVGADPNGKKKDGHKSGYRKDPVLTDMSSAHYDETSLRKLCKIYWVDVLMLNHIGYESNCDWMLKGLPFLGVKQEAKPNPVPLIEKNT